MAITSKIKIQLKRDYVLLIYQEMSTETDDDQTHWLQLFISELHKVWCHFCYQVSLHFPSCCLDFPCTTIYLVLEVLVMPDV